MIIILDFGVKCKFGVLNCVRYNGDFVILVISGFCSEHFTINLAGRKNSFVLQGLCYEELRYPGFFGYTSMLVSLTYS